MNNNSAQTELPKYQCHKQVWALKIKSIKRLTPSQTGLISGDEPGRVLEITPVNEGYVPFNVDENYIAKHNPKEGGYYVQYKDGYKSYSPAKEFEEGYTLIK